MQDPECRASFEEKGLGGHKQTNADLGDLHKRNISIQKKNGQITVNSLLFSSTQQKCEWSVCTKNKGDHERTNYELVYAELQSFVSKKYFSEWLFGKFEEYETHKYKVV